MRHASIFAALMALTVSACATAPTPRVEPTERQALEEAAVRFMDMPPVEETAANGAMVVRVFAVDQAYWPVVEFVAEPGQPVRVSATNVPGNFGARRISADVDPELWKLALEDLQTLKAAPAVGASQTVTVDISALGGEDVEASMTCTPTSWFVLAEAGAVSTPGLPSWNSCANRQAAALPGLYGLALHSLGCGGLEPQTLEVGDVSRCLRLLGRRDMALELSNAVAAARAAGAADDLSIIMARFAPTARFEIRGEAAMTGPEGLTTGWRTLAPGRDVRVGMTTYEGLSDTEVAVKGEAYYVVTTEGSGGQQVWYAPFQVLWVRGDDGWSVAAFEIERPAPAPEAEPIQRYIDTVLRQ